MTLAKTANIKQLITFQKVARLGNVSLAAEELFLSQSATSIQLSNLEEAVGTKLLSRTGRGIRLTEAGEVLYTLCERVLNVWQEVSDEMESYLGDFTGTLRIGAVMDYLIRHGQTQIEEQLAMMSKLPVAEAVVLHSNPTEPEQPSP